MKLHIIGTGGPRPQAGAKRYGTSCIIEINGEMLMLDCGPGTAYKMARMGLFPTQVDTIFITHHHTDHNVDFPCFSLLRFDLDNGELSPLKVYGPAPTKAFVDELVGEKGVFAPDITSRRKHPVALHNYFNRGGKEPRPDTKVEGHDVKTGDVIETKNWKATAVQVPHLEPYIISLAFRIDTDEGSILYLGDSGICPELIEMSKGVDTLITGILSWNTRLDPNDCHHNVSADLPDIVELCNKAEIPKIVGIHGTAPEASIQQALVQEGKRSNINFSAQIVCPEEMTTIEV